MADLLTHYFSARVVGLGLRVRATAMVFTLGAFLPDLLGKPLGHLPGIPVHIPLEGIRNRQALGSDLVLKLLKLFRYVGLKGLEGCISDNRIRVLCHRSLLIFCHCRSLQNA